MFLLVYLYLLADARKFSGVVGILEIWGLAVVDFKTTPELVGALEMAFQDVKASGKPNFAYRPLETFADAHLFPPQLKAALILLVGRSVDPPSLSEFVNRLLTYATDLIGAELLSVNIFLWFPMAFQPFYWQPGGGLRSILQHF